MVTYRWSIHEYVRKKQRQKHRELVNRQARSSSLPQEKPPKTEAYTDHSASLRESAGQSEKSTTNGPNAACQLAGGVEGSRGSGRSTGSDDSGAGGCGHQWGGRSHRGRRNESRGGLLGARHDEGRRGCDRRGGGGGHLGGADAGAGGGLRWGRGGRRGRGGRDSHRHPVQIILAQGARRGRGASGGLARGISGAGNVAGNGSSASLSYQNTVRTRKLRATTYVPWRLTFCSCMEVGAAIAVMPSPAIPQESAVLAQVIL